MKRKIAAICLSAALGISLAACGSTASSGSTQAGSDSQAAASAETLTSDDSSTSTADVSSTLSADDSADASTAQDTAQTGDTVGSQSALADGTYTAIFTTDNTMFHVNEVCDGRGTLTVENGEMTIHITLPSENIVNLFEGTAEDAQKDGADLLTPTVDTVTYEDDTTEECYGYDVPVPYLDEDFDLALLGTKGTWYDHKVSVSDPQEGESISGVEVGSAAVETDESQEEEESSDSSAKTTGKASAADQAAADHVAELIDAIYVQERNANTDEQCKEAKEAWDALTDTQKELVSGENADPDYFGRDTGDASLDDPLNADGIGENELLVVSFGTSYNNSRAADIGGIEKALQEAYPDYSVRRAFTSQIIINHVEARDGEYIDNVDQAMERAIDNGVKNLIVQPTHLMHGAEYDELREEIEAYEDKFDSVIFAEPLLGEVGKDEEDVNADKKAVAEDITAAAVDEARYHSLKAAADDGTAFVFMGHGTSHKANVTYDQMQTQMQELGYENVFIGTVEGKPADTACEAVIEKVHEAGYTKVVLRPLMVVAGDHANNDMAGDDDDSWKNQFKDSGYFDSVDCQIAGLGEIPAIQQIYVQHTSEAAGVKPAGSAEEVKVSDLKLKDGRYVLDVTLEGGTGKAYVESPCLVTVKNNKAEATIVFSSEYYDYMLVDGKRYENESLAGNSSFTIPVSTFNAPIDVTADTTAMSQPHEIDYTLTFTWNG